MDWKSLKIRPTIATTATGEDAPLSIIQRVYIYDDLVPESNAWANISTELAQKAGQYTKQVAVPAHYQEYAKVFTRKHPTDSLSISHGITL